MHWLAAGLMTVFLAAAARAEGERAGAFDYYVMALAWSANWCALKGDARGDDQCSPHHDFTFTLHGLWPDAGFGLTYAQTLLGGVAPAQLMQIMAEGFALMFDKAGACE